MRNLWKRFSSKVSCPSFLFPLLFSPSPCFLPQVLDISIFRPQLIRVWWMLPEFMLHNFMWRISLRYFRLLLQVYRTVPNVALSFVLLSKLFSITYAESKILSLLSRWIVSTFQLSYHIKSRWGTRACENNFKEGILFCSVVCLNYRLNFPFKRQRYVLKFKAIIYFLFSLQQ